MDKNSFNETAQKLSKNPLGIIALFLVLVYALASIIAGFGNIEPWLKSILILFLIIFPVIVLIVFYKLVVNHHDKLYAPSDYKDDKNFIRAIELGMKRNKSLVDSSKKMISMSAQELEADKGTDEIKNVIEKILYKTQLMQYGALTNKVLYYRIQNRVEFHIEKEKDSANTIFDGVQIGGYLYTAFIEDFEDLHNKGIITIKSFEPFDFSISEAVKPAVIEHYEEIFLEDGDKSERASRVSIRRVSKNSV